MTTKESYTRLNLALTRLSRSKKKKFRIGGKRITKSQVWIRCLPVKALLKRGVEINIDSIIYDLEHI
jgi:hypothetical protein